MSAPVITPTSAVLRGLETQVFIADQPVTWSCTGGTIAFNGLYTAPNVTGSYTVTARNSALQSTPATIAVTGRLIWVPSYSSDGKTIKRVFSAQSDSGKRQFRRKSPNKRIYRLVYSDRSRAEYEAVEAFWNAHYPTLSFYWFDPTLGAEKLFYFDSSLKAKPDSYDDFDFSFQIRER